MAPVAATGFAAQRVGNHFAFETIASKPSPPFAPISFATCMEPIIIPMIKRYPIMRLIIELKLAMLAPTFAKPPASFEIKLLLISAVISREI